VPANPRQSSEWPSSDTRSLRLAGKSGGADPGAKGRRRQLETDRIGPCCKARKTFFRPHVPNLRGVQAAGTAASGAERAAA
jgi:hypothetical protein